MIKNVKGLDIIKKYKTLLAVIVAALLGIYFDETRLQEERWKQVKLGYVTPTKEEDERLTAEMEEKLKEQRAKYAKYILPPEEQKKMREKLGIKTTYKDSVRLTNEALAGKIMTDERGFPVSIRSDPNKPAPDLSIMDKSTQWAGNHASGFLFGGLTWLGFYFVKRLRALRV